MKIKVRKIDKKDLEKIDFSNYGTWECEVSEFPWHYDDKESCYILEGHVIVKSDSETIEFKKGDYVIFPKGLDCTWKVLQPVKKYYKFG